MNKFADTWRENQELVLTENGALTYNTSASALVDLFFAIGALRGQPTDRLYRLFAKAFGENAYLATRIMLWARDVRGGAGERKIFRDLLIWLEKNQPEVLELVIPKVPELGRWDDLLVLTSSKYKAQAFDLIEEALRARNGLCAKWMPRQGVLAAQLRSHLNLTPKQYRKVLVTLTDVVETKMCAREWQSINYSQVPSLAQSRYKKAFWRHDEERYKAFGEKAKNYAEALQKARQANPGVADKDLKVEAEKVTVNAGAVYPYDVLKGLTSRYGYNYSAANLDVVRAQWMTLPNYMGEKNILPIVDVSGSMGSAAGNGKGDLTCLDVAVSLGLYMATKNRGAFHNLFMTFSARPELVTLTGEDIVNQVQQMSHAQWDMNTDLSKAFQRVLDHAVRNNVPQEDLPEYLVVLSDMEFDQAASGKTAYQDYVEKFEAKGYVPPKVIWWNIQSRHDNVPVKFNQHGTALVSGFSPSLVESVLSGENVSPADMMMRVIMNPRYDVDQIKKAA